MSKINKKPREIAADILFKILTEASYSNIALNEGLKNSNFELRDKRFVTNIVYGVLTRKDAVYYQLNNLLRKPLKKKDSFLEVLLLIGLFELLYTDSANYGVVNDIVTIAKKRGNEGWSKLVNGVLRNFLRGKDNLKWPDFNSKIEELSFFCSVPLWIGNLIASERGEDTAVQFLESFNKKTSVSIRVNTLAVTRDDLLSKWQDVGVNCKKSEVAPDGIRIYKSGDIRSLYGFKEGFFIVEEEVSQLAAAALMPNEGELVLDMCAAPGGKATYLGALMKDKGTVVAADIYDHKVKLIEENSKRLGLSSIKTVVADGREWGQSKGKFDRVLLDAPCSGLGVLRHRPDMALKKEPQDIANLVLLQKELISAAVAALKVGGRLVFSTCTVTKEENENNRNWLLKEYPFMQSVDISKEQAFNNINEDTLSEGYIQFWPQTYGSDGFFISVFEKGEEL